MIYTITLNPTLDYFMNFLDKKKILNTNRTDDAHLFYGGKGINASVLLTRLGIKNKAIILSGKSTGKTLEDKLKKENIDYVNFNTNNEVRINVKLTFDQTYEFLTNTENLNRNLENELLDFLKENVKENDTVMIMGSTMKGLDENIINNISSLLLKKNAEIVYDLSKNMLELLKYKPFLIKPNREELETFFNTKIKNVDDIKKYANKILEMGAKNLIVSDSDKGAYFFSNEIKLFTEPLKIKLINSSGAGDSMLSGFVYKYISSKSNIKESFKYSNACGAATASSISIGTKDIVDELYLNTKCEEIK
ncbi:MAG: 1-phosphofructokinase family hexose kinase [Mycoplasma sp.]|nr:1-phosphofructokinase family hexose kinase [Mycoplasma sp.]